MIDVPFPTPAEATLVDALRASGRLSISLVATLDGHIVGHVAFSPVAAAGAPAASGLGLGPVAVLPSHQRRGIGHRLIAEGLAAARERGIGYVVVLGEPEYYGRFRFRAASLTGLSDEYGGGDAFQAIELSAGALPRDAGLIKYAPEFAEAG